MSYVLDIDDGIVVPSTIGNPIISGTLEVLDKENVIITYGKY